MFLRLNFSPFASGSAIGIFLFRTSPGFEDYSETEKVEDIGTDFSRIRCPLCQWQPQATSRWYCTDAGRPHYFYNGCGMCWNTFDTKGRCPGCNHQWRWTDCLRCGGCSRHEDWYEDETQRQ